MLKSESPTPLYFRIQEQLRAKIESGEFAPEKPLPTEAQLCEMYGVSRATVREALRSLAQLGMIEKRQGIGTFVSRPKFDEMLPGLNSFSMEMNLRGHSVQTRVLSKEHVAAPSRVAKALAVEESSPVLRVKRLRFLDQKPMLVSTSFLPPFVAIDNAFSASIYQMFKEKYGLHIIQGQAIIEAGLAGQEVAHLLAIEPSAPVLQVIWLAETADKRIVEYSEGTYRGDCYRYIVQVRR